MKTKIIVGTTAALLLVIGIVACSDGKHGESLFPVGSNFPTVPKFLIAIDGVNGGSTTNVNVFPVNATSGALGSPVAGAPFDKGLTDAMTIAVHRNGHFTYVADGNDGSIHQWDVNETTGVPTEIAPKVINNSGSFYQPSGSGDSPTHVITVTPDGRYLYSSNNDNTVGAYKIGSNGALTLIGNVDAGACDTGAITATNSFVWVTDTCGNSGPWHVITMKIGSGGALTKGTTADLTSVFTWLWSIQVNPTGNFLYVGDEGGDAQVYSFKIGTDGSLTQLGPQLVQTSSSDCRFISHSPDGKFFYTSDDEEAIHVMTVDTTTGALGELSSSPITSPVAEAQVEADRSGHFVYAGDEEVSGGVVGFTRDMTTGALTALPTTPTANNSAVAIGVIY
jgi:6-phosphogluconolactonase (cycloisomerase 2 family)